MDVPALEKTYATYSLRVLRETAAVYVVGVAYGQEFGLPTPYNSAVEAMRIHDISAAQFALYTAAVDSGIASAHTLQVPGWALEYFR